MLFPDSPSVDCRLQTAESLEPQGSMEATDVLRELRVEGLVRRGRVGGKGVLWE